MRKRKQRFDGDKLLINSDNIIGVSNIHYVCKFYFIQHQANRVEWTQYSSNALRK